MNPEQVPTPQPIASAPAPIVPGKMQKRTKVALWLMIAPTALLIGAFILFALVNWVFVSMVPAPEAGELFSEPSMVVSISNVLLFLLGTISVITWLPGLIVGIVLLATRK